MQNLKYIIFDMDGVLFDTELLMIQCYEKIAEEYNLPNVRNVCCKCIGVNAIRTQEIFKEHYGDQYPLDEIREKVVTLFRNTVAINGVPVKPYAEDLLCFLKKSNCYLALASSTALDTVIRELKQAGFYDYFDQVIGGDMVKESKPAPDIFLVACEKLGCDPKDTYVIEDSVNGLRAAYAAGTKPLAVPDLIELPSDVHSLCANVFQNLFEALQFFKSL